MKTKASSQNRLLRIITLPIRALGKARDLYVRSMTSYADKVSYGGSAIGMPASHCVTTLPKSFSVNSSKSDDSEDIRELIRAASTRTLGNRVDMSLYAQQQVTQASNRLQKMPPRSCSVGMGRIDEDKPYVFGEDNMDMKKGLGYPRSRSYAVNKSNLPFDLSKGRW